MIENAVLITGASQRVGLYLAKQFLLQKQYPVLITYRTEKESIAELRQMGAVCWQVDFCRQDEFEGWVQELVAQVASLRAIIHNASLWLEDEKVLENPDLYRQMMQLHVQAPWQMNQTFVPLLMASTEDRADIISLSDTSVSMGAANFSAYLSSKAAMQNLVKSFAKKLAPKVKVNDIAPGLLMFHPADEESYRTRRLQRQLLPVEPGPDVVWQAVNYFMHTPYTTGLSLPVDGGVTLGSL